MIETDRGERDAQDGSAAAAAAKPRPADLARGANQNGVRLYNERLVLSLIRRHASLPKAEIARLTGLSAQTISVIMRQLETDGLVVKQGRQQLEEQMAQERELRAQQRPKGWNN